MAGKGNRGRGKGRRGRKFGGGAGQYGRKRRQKSSVSEDGDGGESSPPVAKQPKSEDTCKEE